MNTNALFNHWFKELKAHSASHPYTALGLALSLITIAFLFIHSIDNLINGTSSQSFRWAMMAGATGFTATAIGALPTLLITNLPQKIEDSLLGFAAAAMIFVVSHEVIPEAHRNGHQTTATIGLMIGFAMMMVLDTTLG